MTTVRIYITSERVCWLLNAALENNTGNLPHENMMMNTPLSAADRAAYHSLKTYWVERIAYLPTPYQFLAWLKLWHIELPNIPTASYRNSFCLRTLEALPPMSSPRR